MEMYGLFIFSQRKLAILHSQLNLELYHHFSMLGQVTQVVILNVQFQFSLKLLIIFRKIGTKENLKSLAPIFPENPVYLIIRITPGPRYSKMDQVKFVEDNLQTAFNDMVCLSRPCHFKFFKGCRPQILLGSFFEYLEPLGHCQS